MRRSWMEDFDFTCYTEFALQKNSEDVVISNTPAATLVAGETDQVKNRQILNYFYELIKNRVIALEYLDSAFLIDKFIKWNIYLQNNTNNYSEAKKQFHGICTNVIPL